MKALLALALLAVAGLVWAYVRERRMLARDFKSEAEQACRDGIAMPLHGIAIGKLNYALRDAAGAAFPVIPRAQLAELVRRGLTIVCESCGPLSEATVNQLIVTESSILAGGQDLLGKDADMLNRAGGSCPVCGRTTFEARFDPAALRAAAARATA